MTYLCFGSALSIYYKYTGNYFARGSRPGDLELSSPSSDSIPADVVFKETSLTNILPLAVRIYWLFANVAYVIGAVIVILYWGFVHQDRFLSGFSQAFDNVNMHGIIYLLVVADFWMSSIPIRMMHCAYAVVFGLTYGLFSAIYTLTTDRWIYSVLKWNTEPGQAVFFSLIALGAILIVHTVFYGFDRFKKRDRSRSLVMP